ncbi:hypothetical protein BDR04DRAFT_1099455 [Suillus decipiens]|nr:hypothetical protein BDR04DRAFT_1099455 [Suillus decipiens]
MANHTLMMLKTRGDQRSLATGWNTTSLGDDLFKIRGHGQSGELVGLRMSSSYQPRALKQPQSGLLTDVESWKWRRHNLTKWVHWFRSSSKI